MRRRVRRARKAMRRGKRTFRKEGGTFLSIRCAFDGRARTSSSPSEKKENASKSSASETKRTLSLSRAFGDRRKPSSIFASKGRSNDVVLLASIRLAYIDPISLAEGIRRDISRRRRSRVRNRSREANARTIATGAAPDPRRIAVLRGSPRREGIRSIPIELDRFRKGLLLIAVVASIWLGIETQGALPRAT